ncbi:L-threonine aldolase [Lishizhenia tianjinensis]|uniref:L-threonine aldolase n=1 Tax=Lishizhenia tianjinensis TaxID=477690 RepID=A0A1I6Y657_9FLAO|nr:GntG family PLP-dependent aldolase [Lishizhenia tianjinensis]SFT45624.1 L-threonine aldolase [Lishizhenia tianjinensis]
MIDFRSDTVTKPTAAMKEFMFKAEVGDDVFGDDPTINELERFAAEMFGKEAALFCSSGTQTNQIAINVHCKPGDEVICAADAHIYKYEGGGIAKNSGTSVRLLLGDRGRITADEIAQNINNPLDIHLPLTTLVALEDTMNRGGGAIYDFEEIKKIKALCVEKGLPLHLDGARLFNSLVETGIDYKVYGEQFDSISICLSKGLGAPVGSLLLGSKDFIPKARRVRKVLGGGMRQAGIIAAGGLFALQNHIERLKEDNAAARKIGEALTNVSRVKRVLDVHTNIVVAELHKKSDVAALVEEFKAKGILIMPFGDDKIRIVTHLDNSEKDIDETIQCIAGL